MRGFPSVCVDPGRIKSHFLRFNAAATTFIRARVDQTADVPHKRCTIRKPAPNPNVALVPDAFLSPGAVPHHR
jgi:hypothetical protein